MKNYFVRQIPLLLLAILLTSCAVNATTYGRGFEEIAENTYQLRVYFGGGDLISKEEFQNRTETVARAEAEEFMAQNPTYTAYEIVEVRENTIPSYFHYTVRFRE